MRIGIAQINTTPGDFAAMASRIVSLSQTAASQGVDLLCFPSTTATGDIACYRACEIEFFRDALDAIGNIASDVACPCLIPVPVCDVLGGSDQCALLCEGEMRLFGAEGRLGDPINALGGGFEQELYGGCPFELGSTRFLLAFDEDGLFECDWNGDDFDVVVFAPYLRASLGGRNTLMGCDLAGSEYLDLASDGKIWVVGVAPVGGYGSSVFCGGSFVLSPTGSVVDVARGFDEVLLVCDLVEPGEAVPARKLPDEERHSFLWQLLVTGTRDFFLKQGASHAVLALDGTLASMVTAAIATDALGPTNVHAIVDAPESVEREAVCQRLARNLRIDCRDGSDLAALPGASDAADTVLRRGIVDAYLGAWADELDGMVLSCADKTSIAMGGASTPATARLAPIGDVLLSDVADLAVRRNTASPVIPDATLGEGDLRRAVGCRPSLAGISLADIEGLVERRYSGGMTPNAMLRATALDEGVVLEVARAMDEAECARTCVVPALKVSLWPLDWLERPLRMGWHASTKEHEAKTTGFVPVGRAGDGLSRDGLDDFGDIPDDVLEALIESIDPDDLDALDEPTRGVRHLRDVAEEDMPAAVQSALSYLRDFAGSGVLDAPAPGSEDSGVPGLADGSGNNLTITDPSGNTWPTPFSAN